MAHPRVYADFQNLDDENRLRLTCAGTRQDLERHAIELREGDLRETLADIDGPVDFMLIDIWTPMARPALELVAPRLREGAVVICDNTAQFPESYRDYFDFVNDRANGLRTMTLPFEGGLEFTVRVN